MKPMRAECIVMGASAGALDALSAILPVLPERYPLAVLIVVHLPADRNSLMCELLRTKCRVEVREAEDKEPIQRGTVYLAPPDYHLLVELDQRLSLSSEEPVRYSRPSIDVLFTTAAEAYGEALVAVILTGANDDGAQGMLAVVEAGGTALVQDPQFAHASAMPEAALAACPAARAMTLAEIADYLRDLAHVK